MNHSNENPGALDRILGCLVGGAAGDALGYPVEFMSASTIFGRYGDAGITAYAPDPSSGKAIISDDTQMTLFTAAGLLLARAHGEPPRHWVALAYNDWYRTQTLDFMSCQALPRGVADGVNTDLMDEPALFHRRAPGNACMSSLSAQHKNPGAIGDWIAHRVNDNKGCGGVMRTAPMGLLPEVDDIDAVTREGAQLAAITHGHTLGFLPAGMLSAVVRLAAFGDATAPLKTIVLQAREALARVFVEEAYLPDMLALVDWAVLLSENSDDDLTNIKRLGEGWVGDEALAIALYCALRHQDDFSAGIIAAVNHSGDSDSTGAIAGNILGARLGYAAIEDKWKTRLELTDLMEKLARQLAQ